MVKAVADRRCAARDPVDFDRHDLFSQQRDDAVQRPDPAQVATAPTHRLGPGDLGDDALDGVSKDFRRAPPRSLDHREKDVTALLELVAREPGLAQEPTEGLRRRVDAGSLDLFAARFGGFRDIARDQHQPSRRREGVDRSGRQPRIARTFGK